MRIRPFTTLFIMTIAASAPQVRADQAYAWGYNYFGQLGNGLTSDSNVPMPVIGLGNMVTALAAGGDHTLAINNGAVFAWGQNDGKLGDGTFTDSRLPVASLGLVQGVSAVSAGLDASLALLNGAVYGWGENGSGEIGNGSHGNSVNVPTPVVGLGTGVTSISAGGSHSLAIQNGAVWAWGDNRNDQLGIGIDRTQLYQSDVPVPLPALSSGVTAIAGGGFHSLAIQNGAVWAWGDNHVGQLGNGSAAIWSDVPVAVQGLPANVTAIACGQNFSLAPAAGSVWSWGVILGNGTTQQSNTPVKVPGLSNIVSITATSEDGFALAADGSLWVWGSNTHGELGDGTFSAQLSPEHIFSPDGLPFTSITGGPITHHVVATVALPEPATLGIFGLGATILLARRRRRNA